MTMTGTVVALSAVADNKTMALVVARITETGQDIQFLDQKGQFNLDDKIAVEITKVP